jgi:membrane-associated phospholipid phosphatase
MVYDWERHIPFMPWTIVPYWSIDLLYGLSFLLCRSVQQVDRHALRLLTAQLLSVACFLAFPLTFSFARPATDGLFGGLFDALAGFDQPYNQAPSLHISLLVIIWVRFAGASRARAPAVDLWAALIAASVLTTYQHHFIDLPTGALVGLLCLWLWPDEGPAPLAAPGSRHRPSAGAWPCSTASPASAASPSPSASAAPACGWAGPGSPRRWWRSTTPSSAPQASRNTPAATASPAPPCCSPTPWLRGSTPGCGHAAIPSPTRLPTASGSAACPTQPPCGPAASGPGRPHRRTARPRALGHAGLPWLDLIAPTASQLDAAARHIARLQPGGPVLVACALGYSRSASAVAAWLIPPGVRPRWTRPLPSCSGRGPGSCSARPTARPSPASARQWRSAVAPDTHRAAATAALVAASLGHGRSLDRLSQGLLLALAALLLPELGATACGLLLASLIPAGVQAYHAFRCGLDAHIFAHWARHWPAGSQPDADLDAFDQALAHCFGMRPGAATPRPLDDRARGALRLLRRQALALACQGLLVLAALVTRIV